MLTKRIIPCLDVKNFRTVKGINFKNLQDAGDAIKLAKYYSENGADELVFLDISATQEERKIFTDFVEKVAQQISIPFTIGGGINSIEDMEQLFQAGADKISINSSAVKNPDLIKEASQKFGNQAIVVAIDVKKIRKNKWNIFINGGKIDTKLDLLEWVKTIQTLGAGEILLTSMDCDGVKKGFDIPLLQTIKKITKVPIIASGGAGKIKDFEEIFKNDLADAGLAASIFHFGEIEIRNLKQKLQEKGIPMRL